MQAIEINRLTHTYPDGVKALDQVSLSIRRRGKTAVLGENGSGKTTLLHHLNGLLLPEEGEVSVLGEPVRKERLSMIRRHVGLLFDNPDHQLFSSTVYQDIAFGPRNMGLDEEEAGRRVREAMDRVGIGEYAGKPPHSLSLGLKKRAAIAGVLAMGPEVLICDEPFSGLDPHSLVLFRGILEELHHGGVTLVISTHDVDLAYAWAEDVIVMQGGRLLARGGPELMRDEALMKQAKLERPMLVRAFDGTGLHPRTAEEASAMLRDISRDHGRE